MLLPYSEYSSRLLKRPADNDDDIAEAVKAIIDEVRTGGDDALRNLAERFDGWRPDELFVTDEEIREASASVPSELKEAIDEAKKNILAFHEAQMPEEECVETAPGVVCSRKIVPIERVGLYIPGGTAPLFSTVLMLALPAKAAGCSDIMLATPARNGEVNPAILYAASVSGVDRILKVGGAQAIAAFAFGTESIVRRDKIFGPGNRFVSKAKELVSKYTAIDMIAGPSEVMVAADSSTDPEFAALDLLSQAEHGKDSQVILAIRAEDRMEADGIYARIEEEMEKAVKRLGRSEYVLPSLSHSAAFPVYSDEMLVDIINEYAPEHLIISTREPEAILEGVRNAGSIFLGSWSPESAGDYASGTNHTLPTSGWARSSSGVSLDSFLKKITVQKLTRDGIRKLGKTIVTMAEAEGLWAHSEAAKVRCRDGN